MSFDRVVEFYKRAVADHRFSEDFLDEAKSISSEDELRDFFKERVLPIAKNMGYDFTVDELMSYEREVACELSEEELESVVGGASIKSISAAFVSLFVLMGNIQLSNAKLSRENIIKSIDQLTGNPVSESRAAIAESRVADESVSESEDHTKMSRSVVADSAELCNGTYSTYALKALNLLDPYVLGVTGHTQYIRLFDGNTEKIKINGDVEAGKIPQRKYNEDEGKGSPNYMRTLFPSSAGELSVAGGYGGVARFTADCDPSPELVARIAAYFHGFRNAKEKDNMMKQLSEYEEIMNTASNLTDEKLFDKFYGLLEKYKKAVSDFDHEKNKSLKQYVDVALKEKIKIPEDLLLEIKWTYFQNGLSRQYRAKKDELYKQIGEISGLAGDELTTHIKNTTYDMAKQDYVDVLNELKTLDDASVLKYMVSNEKRYDERVIDAFKANVREQLPGFEDFVKKHFAKDSAGIMAIQEEVEKEEGTTTGEGIYTGLVKLQKDSAREVVKSNPALLNICMSESEKAARDKLKELITFFASNNMEEDVTEESLKTDTGIKKVKAILTVLREGTHMIQYQEVSDEEVARDKTLEDRGTKDKYPKYTTERMLMSYFIEQFNDSSEVNRFYAEINRLIKSDETTENAEMIKRLRALSDMIKAIPKNENISEAYSGAKLIRHGETKTITEPRDGKVSFSGSFEDCDDTTVRHFLNLLFFCKNQSWVDVLPEGVSDELEAAKKAVVKAIESGEEVEFKSLKERVQIFFAHQMSDKVNDGSQVMRSLWNYVVSNMAKESTNDGFYDIRYIDNKNYELDIGFINMLKLIYNIEKALYGSDPEKVKALADAHSAIESLCEEKNTDNLYIAFESVIHVVKPGVDVDMDVTSYALRKGDQDIEGVMRVNLKMSADAKDDIIFKITQLDLHAFVELEEVERESLNVDLGEFKDDPIMHLLKLKFARQYDKRLDDFYEGVVSRVDALPSDCISNSLMLWLIEKLRGQENNDRLIMELLEKDFCANAKVSMDKGVDLFELFHDMYRKSILRNATDFKLAKVWEKNYKYIERDDGVVEIYPTANLKDAKSINIPVGIGGSKKYIISAGGFAGFTNLETLTFDPGMESVIVGDDAFRFSGLKKFIIPANMKRLEFGTNVFVGADKFTDLELKEVEQLFIKYEAFKGVKLKQLNFVGLKKLDLELKSFGSCKIQELNIKGELPILELPEKVFCGDIGTLNLEGVKQLTVKSNAFSEGDVRQVNFIGLEGLTLEDRSFYGCKDKGAIINIKGDLSSLVLPAAFSHSEFETLNIEGVKSLIIQKSAFFNSKVNNINLIGLRSLTLKQFAFAGIKCEELIIPEGIEDLTMEDKILMKSEIQTLIIRSKLAEGKIAEGAFSDKKRTLAKIIVHDEESKKLLEDNRSKYGISDEVKIELAPSVSQQRD